MPAKTKISGTWKDVSALHCRVGGSWKTVSAGHVKIAGAWKPFFTSQQTYRYWRYVEGSAVVGHHPRVSRIDLMDAASNATRLITYTSDNCSDSGEYIIGTVTIDLGAGNEKFFTNARTYSTYAGGTRAANVTVQYSSNNSTWTTAFTLIMANYNYPSGSASCGLFSGYLT